jgi:hypothetical protein
MASSRREPSLRADARARYRESAARDEATAGAAPAAPAAYVAPTKLMPSGDATLTQRVQALYEDSALPVREVARIAGVSERTLYKYVQKGRWRRRNACRGRAAPDGAGVPARARPDFAPVKGAGGRFITRAQAGLPQASGLQALDPEGARQALARCLRAAVLSQAAQAAAAAERETQAQVRTYEVLAGALVALGRMFAAPPAAAAPGAGAGRAKAWRAKAWRAGFVVTARGREWLLPHERAADEARARAQGAGADAAGAGLRLSPQAAGLAGRLQAAILTQMERLVRGA